MRVGMVVFCLSLLLAPLPHGIALNHETRECGGFWGGDEYGGYRLPEGWVDYYPKLGVIETEAGSCRFPDAHGPDREAVVEACCQELGYTYAGTPIGETFTTPLGRRSALLDAMPACLLCLALLLAATAVLLLLWRRRRRGRNRPSEATTALNEETGRTDQQDRYGDDERRT